MSRPSHSSSLCLRGCRARTLEKQSDNTRPVCFHRGQTAARRHWASVRGTDIIPTPEWTGHVWLELCHTQCAVWAGGGTSDWDLLSLFSPAGLQTAPWFYHTRSGKKAPPNKNMWTLSDCLGWKCLGRSALEIVQWKHSVPAFLALTSVSTAVAVKVLISEAEWHRWLACHPLTQAQGQWDWRSWRPAGRCLSQTDFTAALFSSSNTRHYLAVADVERVGQTGFCCCVRWWHWTLRTYGGLAQGRANVWTSRPQWVVKCAGAEF